MTAASPLGEAVRALEAGAEYRGVLERLLFELPPAESGALVMLLKEGRGAWIPLLATCGGRALVVGDACTGTLVALGRAGFAVTALDDSEERLAFARYRQQALGAGRLEVARAVGLRELPFDDAAFDLVVLEDGLRAKQGPGLDELRRISSSELVLVADNRLGYKRSSGLRGDFRVRRPLELLRSTLRPRPGERTLAGYRRALRGAGFDAPRAFALYPHRRDFSHVVALDGGGPRLSIGPMERKNRAKLLGQRLGLFPHFTPSFALVAPRAASAREPMRLARVLEALAEQLGEPVPEVDVLVATRGNTAVVHAGTWTLHVPWSPQQEEQARSHFDRLGRLRAQFPELPVPQPLFEGRLEGLYLTCERRLSGLTAPQLAGDQAVMARLFADAAAHLAGLVVERVVVDEARFDEFVGSKVELVTRYARRPATIDALTRLRDEAWEDLRGRELPLVVYHADLRPKHVQITPEGRVLGYLDWGSSEDADLPLFDLLHLVVHERKQEAGLTAGEAWALVRDGANLRPSERTALDDYTRRTGLEPPVRRAIETLYPALVGAMAEKNWDYSRPLWVHRNFGL